MTDNIDLDAEKEGLAISKLRKYTGKRKKVEKGKGKKGKKESDIDILRILNILQG